MSTCSLCDLPIRGREVERDRGGKLYCCDGCRAIDEAFPDPVSTTPPQEVPTRDTTLTTAFFDVNGMHCATCELFVERAASSVDGVKHVSASYATETMRLEVYPEDFNEETLISRLKRWGYDTAHRQRDTDTSATADGAVPRLLIGVIFGMMTMVWYALGLYPTYFGYEPIIADLSGLDGRYLLANIWLMTTIVLLYTGGPLLRGALVGVQARQPNMDLLVSLAAVGAYSYSAIAVILGRTDIYFDVTVAVVLVVTLGRHYEGSIMHRAADLIGELTALRVDVARIHPTGEKVSLEEVTAGDHVLVHAGERIPLDGTVIEGEAAIDEALLTGAVHPRHRGVGDRVAGGTVVTDAPIVVEVDDAESSALDRIVDQLWHIQSDRSGMQQVATKLAIIFVPLVVVLSSIAAVIALIGGASLSAALLLGLTVLIVSCPCALGLATPMAVATGVKAGASHGIILTGVSTIEVADDIDTLVFDKTGTLTEGAFSVDRVLGHPSTLEIAGALEFRSGHPIARAITDAIQQHNTNVTDVRRLDRGIAGMVDGVETRVGEVDVFESVGWEIERDLRTTANEARAKGQSAVFVGWDGQVNGLILLEDRPQSHWEDTLDSLAASYEIIVLTGDDEAAAQRFRRSAAVDMVFAGLPPDAKAETIRRLRRDRTVAMIGDGSNDAPALAAADLGIALRSGTELAADAADIVLVNTDIGNAETALEHIRSMRSRVRQNLAWAFVYNAVAIPVAIAGLLNPLIAAGAMATSSLLVVINSSRRFPIRHSVHDVTSPVLGTTHHTTPIARE